MSKLLVIFDLNGTLLHRARMKKDKYSLDIPDGMQPIGSVRGRKVYLRPHLEELFADCRFDYAFWTSATKDNAMAIIEYLPFAQPKFVWHRDYCVPNPGGEKPWSVFKDLMRLKELDYRNYVIVDDTNEKILEKDKQHHICIPEYLCEKDDAILKHLKIYLNSLADQGNDYVDYIQQTSFEQFLKKFTE